jgi:hypothetical protein
LTALLQTSRRNEPAKETIQDAKPKILKEDLVMGQGENFSGTSAGKADGDNEFRTCSLPDSTKPIGLGPKAVVRTTYLC